MSTPLAELHTVMRGERHPTDAERDALEALGLVQTQMNERSGRKLWWWTLKGDAARREVMRGQP